MEKIFINRRLRELAESLPESQDTETLKSNLVKAMRSEHSATATVLKYLAEYEIRGLHLREGFPSMFKFLTDGHGYSEGAAMRRLTVARFGRKCPEVFQMIERGDLSLCLASMAARVFENKEIPESKTLEVLHTLSRKSKIESEKILIQFGSQPKKPIKSESLKVIPGATPNQNPNQSPNVQSTASASAKDVHTTESSPALSVFQNPRRPNVIEINREENGKRKIMGDEPCESSTAQDATSEEHKACDYRLSLTLSADTMKAFLRAKELMGTKDYASTIEKLASFYNDRKDLMIYRGKASSVKPTTNHETETPTENCQPDFVTQEIGATREMAKAIPSSPATTSEELSGSDNLPVADQVLGVHVVQAENSKVVAKPISRYIPAPVRRAALQIAGGLCCYVDPESGRRCTERRHLEIDHIKPFAMDGDHSPENLQLLCRSHNLMRAKDDFGAAFISYKINIRRDMVVA